MKTTRTTRSVLAAVGGVMALSATAWGQFGGLDAPVQIANASNPKGVLAVDLSGDGLDDIVVARADIDSIAVYRSDGDGTFTFVGSDATGDEPWAIAAGDINGDGLMDVVVTNNRGASVSVFRGTGNGALSLAGTVSCGTSPRDVELADVSGDGRLDMIVAAADSDLVQVFRWTSGFSFTLIAELDTADFPTEVEVGQITGGTALDIAVTCARADIAQVFSNLGNGTAWGALGGFFTGNSPTGLQLMDYDGDGDQDLVTCNSQSDNVVVVENIGGLFGAGGTFAAGDYPIGMEAKDVNGDGKKDLVVVCFLDDAVSVMLGDGNGGFSSPDQYACDDQPISVSVGRFDAGFSFDVVVGNQGINEVNVLFGGDGTIGGVQPVARLDEPDAFECVCDIFTVTGVADVPGGDFGVATLEYQPVAGGSYTLIGSRTTAVAEPGGTLFSWNTNALAEGYYFVRLNVENEQGLDAEANTIVWVSQNVDVLDYAVHAIAGGTACMSGDVYDNNCGVTYTAQYRPAGGGAFQHVDPSIPTYTGGKINELLASWNTTTVPDGDYVVRVVATNGCVDTRLLDRDIRVDNTAPVARIDTPGNCETFPTGGVIQVTGEASDANISGWALQYVGGDAHNWVTIASGNTSVAGVLADWNVSRLPACCYAIRLVVSDRAVQNCGPSTASREYISVVDVACSADVDGNGFVSSADVGAFLTQYFQQIGPCP